MGQAVSRFCSPGDQSSRTALAELRVLAKASECLDDDGNIRPCVKALLERLSPQDLARCFSSEPAVSQDANPGYVIFSEICSSGKLIEIRYVLETLYANFWLRQVRPLNAKTPGTRWLSSLLTVALTVKHPSLDVVKYLLQQGCLVNKDVLIKWANLRCDRSHLRCLLKQIVKHAKRSSASLPVVALIFEYNDDRNSRAEHVQALRNLMSFSVDDVRFLDQRGRLECTIANIVEEDVFSIGALVDMYEVCELYRQINKPTLHLNHFRESAKLRRSLCGVRGLSYGVRKQFDSEEDVDALELHMTVGEFVEVYWQLLFVAARLKILSFTLIGDALSLARSFDDVIEVKGFVVKHYAFCRTQIKQKLLELVTQTCVKIIRGVKHVPLRALFKLHQCLEEAFSSEYEEPPKQIASLSTGRPIIIAINEALRRLQMRTLSHQLDEMKGQLDETLFLIAYGAPDRSIRELDAVTRSNIRTVVYELLRRGASISKLPGHSVSALRLLLGKLELRTLELNELIAKRVCCSPAVHISDSDMLGIALG